MGAHDSKESTTDEIEGDKTSGGFNFGVVHSNFHSGGWCILTILAIVIISLVIFYWYKKKHGKTTRIQSPQLQHPEYGFFRQIRNSFKKPRSSEQVVIHNPQWTPAKQSDPNV